MDRRRFLARSAAAAAGLALGAGCAPKPVSRPPNILFLSLDTTRADHLSCYGYPRRTSPNLDRLAIESLVYSRALSTSSWTLPAHASMFTGKFVSTHGARKYDQGSLTLRNAFAPGVAGDRYKVVTVAEDEVLLAEHLKAQGYTTGAVVAGPWLKKPFGLHRGFDHHDDDNILGVSHDKKRIGFEVTERALKWLETTADEPFFLFLNYFDAHSPYSLPERLRGHFAGTPKPDLHEIDQPEYDIGILTMDMAIGRLLDVMRERGQYDNTLIVTVGDHGEQFGEHGTVGHGQYLYQGSLHVPYFVKYPLGEVAPRVTDRWVQVTDILPLIFERLDLDLPPGVQGSPPGQISHPMISEVYPSGAESKDGHWQSLVEGDYKLLYGSLGHHELYNLRVDPRETKNLVEEDADRVQAMTARLRTHMNALPRPEGAPTPLVFDDEDREALESAGYL